MIYSKILWVDDDPDDRDFIAHSLSEAGAADNCIMLDSFNQLLDILPSLSKPSRLIVIGANSNHLDIKNVIGVLRDSLSYPEIKIAVYANNNFNNSPLAEFVKNDCVYYLKPFGIAAYKDVIRDILPHAVYKETSNREE